MPLFISGSNGISGADGTAALPAVQGSDGNTGVFFPAADQVAIATGGVQRLLVDASGIVTGTAGNLMLVSGTAVASTSGTSIDFTGIPSWVRRVTVMLNGVSTNGSANVIVQLGSGSFVTTGYASQASIGTTNSGVVTTGLIAHYPAAASRPGSGHVTLTQISTNLWVYSAVVGFTNITLSTVVAGGAAPTLSGALDRIRIATANGTDVFNAGSLNIMYE